MSKDRSNELRELFKHSKFATGVYAELKVFDLLRNHGFLVFRHPHSATPDLWAWRNGVLYLIEVKSTFRTSLTINPAQVECIRSMLQFFANTTIPAVGFVVVYFVLYDEFGVKKIDPIGDNIVTVGLGDHDPELPL